MTRPVDSVVFHDSNCYNAEDFDELEDVEEFQIKDIDSSETDFHLLIGKNGRIMRGLSNHRHEKDQLHIFMLGDFREEPPTSRQMKTLNRLFDWFEYKFKWRVEPEDCHRHSSIEEVDNCPGELFPIETFKGQCASRLDNPEETPFHDFIQRQKRRHSLDECNREIKRINGDMSKNLERFDELTDDLEALVETAST